MYLSLQTSFLQLAQFPALYVYFNTFFCSFWHLWCAWKIQVLNVLPGLHHKWKHSSLKQFFQINSPSWIRNEGKKNRTTLKYIGYDIKTKTFSCRFPHHCSPQTIQTEEPHIKMKLSFSSALNTKLRKNLQTTPFFFFNSRPLRVVWMTGELTCYLFTKNHS